MIASLVYLATQIRHSRQQMDQNTRALRSSGFQQFRGEVSQAWCRAIDSPELASIVRVGLADYDQLDDAAAFQFGF